jgi:hypothetical protein
MARSGPHSRLRPPTTGSRPVVVYKARASTLRERRRLLTVRSPAAFTGGHAADAAANALAHRIAVAHHGRLVCRVCGSVRQGTRDLLALRLPAGRWQSCEKPKIIITIISSSSSIYTVAAVAKAPTLSHSLTHSLTHCLTHSITHSLTRSLAHSDSRNAPPTTSRQSTYLRRHEKVYEVLVLGCNLPEQESVTKLKL